MLQGFEMAQVAGDKVMNEASASPPRGGHAANIPGFRPKGSALSRNAIASVLQYWKVFDLDSKRVLLDTQGGTMKTEKDNSVRSRKKLAETTKAFRKLSDAEKISGMGGLLRAYQEEIDSLTKRAKYSENAFFLLYKGLYAAPDPVPSLESITELTKNNDLEEDNKKLKRELHEYEIEFSSLKNQDITIRKLEEQMSLMERNMEDAVHQQAAKKCKDLEDQLAAKELEFSQQKVDYERQVEHGRDELRDAFSRLDALQSELFAYKQRSGLAKSAMDAELEMISQETIVMQTLRLENTQLKKQIEDLLSVGSGGVHKTEQTNDHEIMSSGSRQEHFQHEATIANLRQEMSRMKDAATRAEQFAESEKARLEDMLDQAKRVQDDLTAQLEARPTMENYNEMLHQLHVLQQLEYNIVDEDENQTAPGGGSSELSGNQAASEIEKILLSRVRRLEHSLRHSELQLEQRATELQDAHADLERRNITIQELNSLVRTLEETVSALESRRTSGKSGKPTDVGSEILMEAMDTHLSERNAPGDAGVGIDNKMFEIVRGQRDRFRERMKELQVEKNTADQLAATYKAQVSRLEADNMQLFEKIRYLQSYVSGSNKSRGGRSNLRVVPGLTPNTSMYDFEGGAGVSGSDVESRYKSMYDEKMNPFHQFNKLESQQRYTNLNAVDKILLNSAKIFLGHRITRNIAFGYILLLHFLVFATLYTFMHGCGISND